MKHEIIVGTKLYRYDDCYYSDYMEHSELHVTIYQVVKVTNAGFWVLEPSLIEAYKEDPKMPHAWSKPKFVLDGWDGKRLCYPTLRLALLSYTKRKARQILLTTNTLRKAEAMLKLATRMNTVEELKLPAHLQPQTQEPLW